MATKTKTATKTKMTKVPTTLHGKMDRIQEMIEFLSNDITDGTITNNEITRRNFLRLAIANNCVNTCQIQRSILDTDSERRTQDEPVAF
jgi:hypothetical protein